MNCEITESKKSLRASAKVLELVNAGMAFNEIETRTDGSVWVRALPPYVSPRIIQMELEV